MHPRQSAGRSLRRAARTGGLGALLCAAAVVGPAGAQDGEPIQLKFVNIASTSGGEFWDETIAAFEEQNPGIDVVYEEIPNEAYKTAIQVQLSGSEPPDIFFNWIGEDSNRLIREGLVADLTEVGEGEGSFRELLSQGWLDAVSVDAHIYAVPRDAVSKFFYYNVPFFEEHGLAVPATFEELTGLCRSIREIDPEMVPLPLGNSERWKVNHYITMLNERVLGQEATADDYALTASADELFTDPGYVEAWTKLLDMQEAGCFQDAPNATSPEISRTMFSSEASPMIYCGSWCAGIFDSEGFTDYAMFRFPSVEGGRGDPNTNFVITQGHQVSAASEHPEEAVRFLSFLSTPEVGARYAEMTTQLPANPALLESAQGLTEQFKWIANDVSTVSAQVNVLDVLLENAVSEAYLNAGVEILNGTLTPEEAMEGIRQTALEAKQRLGVADAPAE